MSTLRALPRQPWLHYALAVIVGIVFIYASHD